jgi:hypothetical protein
MTLCFELNGKLLSCPTHCNILADAYSSYMHHIVGADKRKSSALFNVQPQSETFLLYYIK